MADRKLRDPRESLRILLNQHQSGHFNAVQQMPDVRQGYVCGTCRHFMDKQKGQEALRQDEFWDRCFHQHDDGHDLKPHHIGDPTRYSICKLKDVACHESGVACQQWEAK